MASWGKGHMNPLPTVAIIVTTYNQRPTLELLLASLEEQTCLDFEVLLADDGSSDGAESLCLQKREFPVRWISQKDDGYRKSQILNQAIRSTQCEYLIFVDGDVVLEKHFVEDHLRLRKRDHFVCGRRVDLGPVLSERLLGGFFGTHLGTFRWKFHLFLSALRKDSISLKRCWRVKTELFRRFLGYDRPLDLLGSNFSLYRENLVEVNGFNEDLKSYWGEDGDLFIRLRNSGKKSVGAKSLCIQYHVFHERRQPTQETVDSYARGLLDQEYKWAKQGLKKLSE